MQNNDSYFCNLQDKCYLIKLIHPTMSLYVQVKLHRIWISIFHVGVGTYLCWKLTQLLLTGEKKKKLPILASKRDVGLLACNSTTI